MRLTTVSSWATFLMCLALACTLIYLLHYKPRHRALECAHCEKRFTTPPVLDVESWLPVEIQPYYCSTDCLNDASERYWMHVWSDQS